MEKTEVLQRYFGHSSFRKGQGELIDNILSGRDCLGVMPTGAGKSMCYQIPALMLEGTTIVVSPLISLMKDQVEALCQSGVPAGFLNSSQTAVESRAVYNAAVNGGLKILYVAPERLGTESFTRLCQQLTIPLVAVDEAHCVSHWGQDFRPSYLRITEFVRGLPQRPVIAAFTATATDVVKQDIVKILCLNDPFTVTTGFDRANLYFEVRRPSDKDAELLSIVRSFSGSAIVYCSTRKNVESVCDMLKINGVSAAMYHAGLPEPERRRAQDDFLYDRVNVMVATNAFGMGIDKSDVSLVVHYNMPKDLESYYQEAGRAGRDGSPARCILLYAKRDVSTAEYLIEHSHEENDELSVQEIEAIQKRDRERLKQMTFYSTTTKCLREFILKYFGENTANFCGNCGSCNSGFETVDITTDAQKILSCIYRLKQRSRSAGKSTIAAILTGSDSDKVRAARYDTLSTYGIMRGTSRNRICDIMDFLHSEGMIEVEGEYHTCTLTPAADAFVRSGSTLLMKLPKEQRPAEKAQPTVENPELMAKLKELRRNLAASLSVPAYVVFTDATLREMSAKMPLTSEEFRAISGVGAMKAERYGKKFIALIREYKNGT
ncbi:MAG: DNA helicase RecQ [Oscillospiraceae bacterium]